MILVTWRVAGEDFDLPSFLRAFEGFTTEARWSSGDSRLGGGKHRQSGFNKQIGEFDSSDAAIAAVEASLVKWGLELAYLHERRIESVFDVGLIVGAESQFTSSVTLPTGTLGALAASYVSVMVSAYPAHDRPA